MEEDEISGKELLRPDNSLAAASRVTDDLIVEILSRLPFRSVCRSKCVSKTWRDLIAHPAHRRKLPQTLAGVLYTTNTDAGGKRYHLASLSAEAEGLDLDPSLAFLPHTEYGYFGLQHACNGLLLCSYRPALSAASRRPEETPRRQPVAHPDAINASSNSCLFRRPMEEEEISGKELLRPDYSLAEAAAAAAASRLTDDLIVEILSRLPFRSVCRSKCVSKPWRDLIAHPAHRKKLPQTLAGVLYTTNTGAGGYRYHLAGLSAEAEGLDLDPSLAFLPHMEYGYFGLERACNGLLLCSYRPDEETVRLVACNPATQRWTELPPRLQPRPNTCRDYKEFHLAFDPAVPSHFHVFDFERNDNGSAITGARIYSSRTGAWRQRDAAGLVEDVYLTHHSVLVGGMLHVVGNLLVPADSNNWEDKTVLVAVDMEGKVWKTISVPRGRYYGTVGWSQGCLHYAAISPAPLTVGDDDEDEDTLCMAQEVAIWRLEDYDTQQWALKQSFRADKVLDLAELEYQLVGFHPDRDTFFLVSRGLYGGDLASLVSWDMRCRQICDILDLEKGSVLPYLPYVPLFSSEPLADADGH